MLSANQRLTGKLTRIQELPGANRTISADGVRITAGTPLIELHIQGTEREIWTNLKTPFVRKTLYTKGSSRNGRNKTMQHGQEDWSPT